MAEVHDNSESLLGERIRDRTIEEYLRDFLHPPTPIPGLILEDLSPLTYFSTSGSVTSTTEFTTYDIVKALGRASLSGVVIVDEITSGVGGLVIRVNHGNDITLNLGDWYIWPPVPNVPALVQQVRRVDIKASSTSGSAYRFYAV